MTRFHRILELREQDASELIVGRAWEVTVAFPIVRWRDGGAWCVWPIPAPGHELLYDRDGVPQGFIVESYVT